MMFGQPIRSTIPLGDLSADPRATLPVTFPDLPEFSVPKRGMFGGGNIKDAAMAAVAGFMARRNPQMSQSLMNMMMLKQKQGMEDAQYQRERQDKFDDFKQQYDYKLAHPEPINNDTANDYAFWQQHLNPDQFQQWVQSRIDPAVVVQTPNGPMPMLRSQISGMAAPPTKPVGPLTPIDEGGAGQAAPRPFPR